MTRQTTQKLITALYPRLSHEDTLQGESNSISNQDGICQGYFLQKRRHRILVPYVAAFANPAFMTIHYLICSWIYTLREGAIILGAEPGVVLKISPLVDCQMMIPSI